ARMERIVGSPAGPGPVSGSAGRRLGYNVRVIWRERIRRIAPLAILVLLGLLVDEEGCKARPVESTLRVYLEGEEVQSVRVELLRGDEPEPVAYFETYFEPGQTPLFESRTVSVPVGAYTAAVTVTGHDGAA